MALWPTVSSVPAKCGHLRLFTPKTHHFSIFKSTLTFNSSFTCCCIKNQVPTKPTQGFSVLSSDIPWDGESVWSTMAMYMFFLHIPLGVGGMSIVAYVLHQPVLDPKTENYWLLFDVICNKLIASLHPVTGCMHICLLVICLFFTRLPSGAYHPFSSSSVQALSLLIIQIVELTGTILLLRSTAKSEFELKSFFNATKLTKDRNWLLSSTVGFGFLVLLVFLASILADCLTGNKAVNNPIVKEILSSSDMSRVACLLVYCCITPLLEETVYRGFLFRSLFSTMKWWHAVLLSSAVFSVAHFSA